MKISEKKYQQRISLGQSGNSLMTLVAICLIMFVMMAFLKAVWYFRFEKEVAPALFDKNVLKWLILPADTGEILNRPWTIITHMFVHDNIWRVFANMLWLWCFGYILQDLTGNKKLIPVFVYGALGGALAFTIAYNLMPSLQPLIQQASIMGASAGVMAVAVVTTIISPGYRIFPMIGGGIPLWAVTALFIITDLATVSISETGVLIAHLAGAFTGILFIIFLRMGFDWSEWMNNFFEWIGNLFNPDRPKKGKSPKEELFYKTSAAPYKKTPHITQQRIDEILDKISQQGYNHLTEEEKEMLKRASQEDFKF